MPTWNSRDGVTSRLRMRGHDYTSAASYFIDERGLERARAHVEGNPAKWADDEYFQR